MNDKQPIEVGQVWQVKQENGAIATVQKVSPAWVTLENDDFIWRLRKGNFRSEWRLEDGGKLDPIQLDDTPTGNTSTHAAMQAAVAAFNAQTGLRLTEAHGWQLMLNLHLAANRTGESIHAFGDQVFALYQESREVD